MNKTQGILISVLLSGSNIAMAAQASSEGALNSTTNAARVQNTVSAELRTGLRSASFRASPTVQNMWLNEYDAAVLVDVWSASSVTVGAGAVGGLFDLRGDLGRGLTEFSGYRFGPEVRASYRAASSRDWGTLRPFVALSYQYGSASGEGSENWGGDRTTAQLTYGPDAIATTSKSFTTYGTHATAGAGWDFSTFGLIAAYDIGVETLLGNNRVIAYGAEIENRKRTDFNSRSFQLGVSARM